MSKSDSESLDRKVLTYLKARGTTNVNRVARQFKVKWETARRSLSRLMAKGHVFYYPDMKLWSIWSDQKILRCFDDGHHTENREFSEESDVLYARFLPSLKTNVRGQVAQTIETEGFVCHPRTKGHEVSRDFIRGHIHGHYSVDVIEEGRMPQTYADSDRGYSGQWYSKKMNGNHGFFGEITLPEDPVPFKVHALSTKNGSVQRMAVYVHPRYMFIKNNERTAMAEFENQVRDVLSVLGRYGWKFGKIELKGYYSMGINDRVLAANVPTNHVESDSDIVRYDSSPGHADGVCTEAEIYADHPTAEAEVMVQLPSRILGIEYRMQTVHERLASIESRLTNVTKIVEMNTTSTEQLVSSVEGLSRLTEFNTNVLLGNQVVPSEGTPDYIAKTTKGDVMYG